MTPKEKYNFFILKTIVNNKYSRTEVRPRQPEIYFSGESSHDGLTTHTIVHVHATFDHNKSSSIMTHYDDHVV